MKVTSLALFQNRPNIVGSPALPSPSYLSEAPGRPSLPLTKKAIKGEVVSKVGFGRPQSPETAGRRSRVDWTGLGGSGEEEVTALVRCQGCSYVKQLAGQGDIHL